MKPALLLLSASLMAMTLACTWPDEGLGKIQTPDPSQNSLAFKYDGPTTAIAGSWGFTWQVEVAPSTGPDRWHLDGPGTLMQSNSDGTRSPADLTSSTLPAEGYYVPPASVPAGGITVNLSVEVYSPFTKRWELSQKFPIQVVQQTAPMSYASVGPVSATVHAGQSTSGLTSFIIQVKPRPLDLQQSATLIPGSGAPSSIGSTAFTNIDNSDWALDYTAPTTVAAPFDLILQATAHDPWMNQDRILTWPVHVEP